MTYALHGCGKRAFGPHIRNCVCWEILDKFQNISLFPWYHSNLLSSREKNIVFVTRKMCTCLFPMAWLFHWCVRICPRIGFTIYENNTTYKNDVRQSRISYNVMSMHEINDPKCITFHFLPFCSSFLETKNRDIKYFTLYESNVCKNNTYVSISLKWRKLFMY